MKKVTIDLEDFIECLKKYTYDEEVEDNKRDDNKINTTNEHKMNEYIVKQVTRRDLKEVENEVLKFKTSPRIYVKEVYYTETVQNKYSNTPSIYYTATIIYQKEKTSSVDKLKDYSNEYSLVEDKQNTLIKDLPISTRFRNRLYYIGKYKTEYNLETFTVKDMINKLKSGELLKLRNMGIITIKEELDRLIALGYLKKN